MANLDASLPWQKLVYAEGFDLMDINNNSNGKLLRSYRNPIILLSAGEGIADFTKKL